MNIKFLSIIFFAAVCLMIPLCANAETESAHDNYDIVMIEGEAPETPETTTTVNESPSPSETSTEVQLTPDENVDSSTTTESDSSSSNEDQNEPGLNNPEKLLVYCSLSVRSDTGTLFITAKTQSAKKLSSVGFKQICIQRSSDAKKWENEKILDGITENNSGRCFIDNYMAQVDGGYYYRVVCTHYASSGNNEHKLDNVSTYEWIDASPVYTTSTPSVPTKSTDSYGSESSDGNMFTANIADNSFYNAPDGTLNEEIANDHASESAAAIHKLSGVNSTAHTSASSKNAVTKITASKNASSERRASTSSPNTSDKGISAYIVVLCMLSAGVLMTRKKFK